MKRALLVVALVSSLVANFALLVSRVRLGGTHEEARTAPVSIAPVAATPVSESADPLAHIDPATWFHVTASNAALLMAQLSSKGFHPAVVRAIATAHIRAAYAER